MHCVFHETIVISEHFCIREEWGLDNVLTSFQRWTNWQRLFLPSFERAPRIPSRLRRADECCQGRPKRQGKRQDRNSNRCAELRCFPCCLQSWHQAGYIFLFTPFNLSSSCFWTVSEDLVAHKPWYQPTEKLWRAHSRLYQRDKKGGKGYRSRLDEVCLVVDSNV